MLVASFTSKNPTMGEYNAHLKSRELLGILHNATNMDNQQPI